mgnify:CR=1 FL=1
MSALLDLQNVSKSFGGLHVNRDVSFSLGKGDRVALIGPNGAGKSTLMRTLAGMQPPLAGHITLGGDDLTTLQPRGDLHPGGDPWSALTLASIAGDGRRAACIRFEELP